MIQVELSKIIIDDKRRDQVVVLKEKGGSRQFPIIIGYVEASSIQFKVTNVKMLRPMTHDLMATIVNELDARLDSLIIDDMVKNTYHAKLKLIKADGSERMIDARPSDGIALAVRLKAPIFVTEFVLEKATILEPE